MKDPSEIFRGDLCSGQPVQAQVTGKRAARGESDSEREREKERKRERERERDRDKHTEIDRGNPTDAHELLLNARTPPKPRHASASFKSKS